MWWQLAGVAVALTGLRGSWLLVEWFEGYSQRCEWVEQRRREGELEHQAAFEPMVKRERARREAERELLAPHSPALLGWPTGSDDLCL